MTHLCRCSRVVVSLTIGAVATVAIACCAVAWAEEPEGYITEDPSDPIFDWWASRSHSKRLRGWMGGEGVGGGIQWKVVIAVEHSSDGPSGLDTAVTMWSAGWPLRCLSGQVSVGSVPLGTRGSCTLHRLCHSYPRYRLNGFTRWV